MRYRIQKPSNESLYAMSPANSVHDVSMTRPQLLIPICSQGVVVCFGAALNSDFRCEV